ncbi:hypothetical protein AYI68_g8315 [Smittium mucronatum]|uniref:Uncharacterized protein n=1 Tax=Smittium mucronatum TaxID=133383 RepID=A0A1R0GL86_9FUNG|nr:hypothetical protein AYI68_g8315 [Smittium mucronatum]
MQKFISNQIKIVSKERKYEENEAKEFYYERSIESLENSGRAICGLITFSSGERFCGKLIYSLEPEKSGKEIRSSSLKVGDDILLGLESPLKVSHSDLDFGVSDKLAGSHSHGLNESQKKAIKMALSDSYLTLIHGPPDREN